MSRDRGRALRDALVRSLRSNGSLRSAPVEAAMSTVPRELFVPPETPIENAYADHPLVLTRDEAGRPTSTISQPSMVALMLEQLGVLPGQRVLEIGTASGYNAALLAQLTGAGGSVTTVELDAELAATARDRLAALELAVDVRAGDGWLGAADAAPFDRVVVTVGVDDLSPDWVRQLRDGGVLVVPITLRPGLELSVALVRRGDELRASSVHPCGFVRLRGPHAQSSRTVLLDDGAVLRVEPIADAERLRALLGTEPVDAGPIERVSPGWAVHLTLGSTHPLVLVTADAAAFGLQDPEGGGVALLVGDRITSYGDAGAVRLLREHLAASQPLEAAALQITVRPVDAAPPPGRWIIRTPHFAFGIGPG